MAKRRKPTKEVTFVVFRKWRETGDVIALFPALPADIHGRYCDAYEHVGQHGGADYHGVIQATRPVSGSEAASLKRELTRRGYRLVVIQRASAGIHRQRITTAHQLQ